MPAPLLSHARHGDIAESAARAALFMQASSRAATMDAHAAPHIRAILPHHSFLTNTIRSSIASQPLHAYSPHRLDASARHFGIMPLYKHRSLVAAAPRITPCQAR